jgi:alpha-D-xyloside xylohydrolase
MHFRNPPSRPSPSPIFCVLAFFALTSRSSLAEQPAQQPAFTRSATEVSVPVEGATIVLLPLEEGVIRVRVTAGQASAQTTDETPSMILLGNLPTPRFEVSESPGAVTVSTGRLSAKVDLRAGTVAFFDVAGKLLLASKPGGRALPTAMPGQEVPTLQETFLSPKDEHLFGGGQFQDGFLDIRDLPRRLTQVNTQISIPFFLSSKGYGLLWHNYGRTDLNPADQIIALTPAGTGTYSIGQSLSGDSTGPDTRNSASFTGDFEVTVAGRQAMMLDSGWKMERLYNVEIDGKSVMDFANFWLPPTTSWFSTLSAGRHTIRITGDSDDKPTVFFRPAEDQTTLRSFTGKQVDYVVFAGPASDDVIRRYRDVTGTAPMMPQWAYGYIQSRARYHTQQELLDNLSLFREKKLPLDLIVQDWMYWGKYNWNAMRFDEGLYPDPAGMVKAVHDQHAHIMISVWSNIDPDTEIGKEFKEKHYYVSGTTWVDFLNLQARALYWKDFRTRMVPLGFDAWWLDATEPENDDLHGRTVATGSGDDVRMLYSFMVNKTVYEGMRKDAPNRRFMILTRNAFLGEQRFASAVWSGDVGNDWETLKREIVAGLGYSASGMPYWTTDTGGFFRPGVTQFADAGYHERLIRWLEFSTFTPLMRIHGWLTPTEPWLYGAQVDEVTRKYLNLRYRMLPYAYSNAADVTRHGSTLLRPLVMDFPRDETALSQRYEFMDGKSLLVAPVVAPGVEISQVYLPNAPAGWYDFWSESHLAGGKTVDASARLDQIPLFVPAGSILPLGPEEQYVNEKPADPIEVRIYPGADAAFTLYEDEGTNYNYEKGAFATIRLQWNDARHELQIGKRAGAFANMLANRHFRLHIAGSSTAPQTVAYHGEVVRVVLK